MTTYLWLWTFIVIASLSYVTLALPLAQGNEDILAPPLLVKTTTARIIVPPTLSPWMKLVQQRQTSSASTTPSVIRPPTIRPPKDLNQPTTLHDLIQPPTLHPPLAPAPDPDSDLDSDPDSDPAPAPTPPLAVTHNPTAIFPTKLPTPTPVSQTSRPVSIPVPAKALGVPVSNQGTADVTTGPAVVVNHHSVDIGIGIGISRNGTSDTHTGSSLPSAALDASNASSNSAASFICYGRGPMTVDRDVPCPFESTRKAEMPPEFLEVLLRDEGGSIISSVMSTSPPEHLMGFDLSNIESSDWMNFNQSDLGARLVEYIIHLEEHGRRIQQHLQDQVSSNRLQNITALTNLFIGVINATTNLNVCSSASSSAIRSSSSSKDLPCNLLVNHTVRLTEISFAVNSFVSVVQLSDSWLMNITKSDVNNGGAYDNLDITVIDELLQKFDTTKAQLKIFVSLHKNLSSAIHDFNNTVAKIKDKLLHSLGDTDTEKLNMRRYGSVDFKNVADVLAYVNNWRGESEDDEAHNHPTVDKSSEHNEQFVHDRNTDSLRETLSMNTSTKSGIISYLNTSEQSTDTKPAASETGSLDSANLHHDLSNLPKDSNQFNSTIEYREHTEEERMDPSGVRPEYLVQAALLGILDSLQEELSKLLLLPAPSNILSRTENDEALNNMTSWHHLRRRTRRDVAGFTIASETCQHQGRPINQSNYISLCTTCMHTTVLDDSLYPRYITEKICSNGSSSDPLYSNGCLFNPGPYSGGPGGLCQQQEFHIIVLQRVPGRCMKVFDQGQELVTDKWQSTTIPLKIGCECVVNENSQFAKYATFP